MNEDIYKAWLHFKGKAAVWEFVPNPKYNRLIHITRYGNIYGIFQGANLLKPFWIGRFSDNFWGTIEGKLRVKKIEFGNGGEYIFPRKPDLRYDWPLDE